MEKAEKKRKIAVVIASMSGIEYAYETIGGIVDEAKEIGADVYIFNANISTDETVKHNIGEYAIYTLPDFMMFDGIILFANLIQGYSVYNNVIERIRGSKVMAVCIDTELEGFFFAGVENYLPMKRIVNHLIEHHHYTKINLICGQNFNSDNQERVEAYMDALTEHGIPVEEKRIFRGAFTNEHGRMAAQKMLKSKDGLPEAVVCATDTLAIGAMMVFENQGIDVPGQIAVTGFDNVFEARNSIPRLTTVDRNLRKVGRESVRKLFSHLNGEAVLAKERFPANPVIRESCGCTDVDQGDIQMVRKRYMDAVEEYVESLYSCNTMMEELNGSRNFAELLRQLERHVRLHYEGGFYLCLDKFVVEELKGNAFPDEEMLLFYESRSGKMPDELSVAFGYEGGVRVQVTGFASKEMLPAELLDEEETHTYVFAPIHFRDNCMGYLVTKDCSFPMKSPLFNSWMIDLCNCLECLRKQNNMKKMVEQLDQMCVIDALTGLYNRLGFERYTEMSFRRCKRKKKSFMLLFVDMDGLKTINDQYGHDDGDLAILTVSNALKNAGNGTEVCARYGGDEFVIYSEGYSEQDAKDYCETFQNILNSTNEEKLKPYLVSASCGYVIATPTEGEILDKYIDIADNYMYRQKQEKKAKMMQ